MRLCFDHRLKHFPKNIKQCANNRHPHGIWQHDGTTYSLKLVCAFKRSAVKIIWRTAFRLVNTFKLFCNYLKYKFSSEPCLNFYKIDIFYACGNSKFDVCLNHGKLHTANKNRKRVFVASIKNRSLVTFATRTNSVVYDFWIHWALTLCVNGCILLSSNKKLHVNQILNCFNFNQLTDQYNILNC